MTAEPYEWLPEAIAAEKAAVAAGLAAGCQHESRWTLAPCVRVAGHALPHIIRADSAETSQMLHRPTG